jgi:hypothetical protein
VEEVQSIEFKDADSKNLNIKETPVNVTATTKTEK